LYRNPDILSDFFRGITIIFEKTILLAAKDPGPWGAGKKIGKQTSSVKCDMFLINCHPTGVTCLPE
jgi:hypothetical protein